MKRIHATDALTDFGQTLRVLILDEGYGRNRLIRHFREKLGLELTARNAQTIIRKVRTQTKHAAKPQPKKASKVVDGENMDISGVVPSSIRTLKDLMEYFSIDPEEWVATSQTVNMWESQVKGGGVLPLHQIKASFIRSYKGLIEPGLGDMPVLSRTPPRVGSVETTLFIPDTQHGHIRKERSDGEVVLVPFHDREFIDTIISVAELEQPDNIVLLGDHLDFPELSTKFVRHPNMNGLLNAAMREFYWMLAQLRQVCSHAKIYWVRGNHEQRLETFLQERAPGFCNLQAVGGERVLELPHLMNLDSVGVEMVGKNYGDALWLYPNVKVTHGDGHTKREPHKMLMQGEYSSFMGHIHSSVMETRVVNREDGPRRYYACCPGTGSRIDGSVPSRTNAPTTWTQGFALLHMDTETMKHWAVNIPVVDGACVLNGMLIQGEPRSEEIAKACNIPALGRSL